MLRILFNLYPDVSYKQYRFFKTLLEKGFKFVPSKGGGIVALNLGLVLLLAKVNLIPKEQGRKGDVLEAYNTSRVKIVLALLTEVIALYL